LLGDSYHNSSNDLHMEQRVARGFVIFFSLACEGEARSLIN